MNNSESEEDKIDTERVEIMNNVKTGGSLLKTSENLLSEEQTEKSHAIKNAVKPKNDREMKHNGQQNRLNQDCIQDSSTYNIASPGKQKTKRWPNMKKLRDIFHKKSQKCPPSGSGLKDPELDISNVPEVNKTINEQIDIQNDVKTCNDTSNTLQNISLDENDNAAKKGQKFKMWPNLHLPRDFFRKKKNSDECSPYFKSPSASMDCSTAKTDQKLAKKRYLSKLFKK